jgi:ATP-dependent RNA helicase DeaD
LAFGLPLVNAVDDQSRALQALVLVPTRELAQQVGGVLKLILAGTAMKVTVLFGGQAIGPQQEALRQGAHIVVGTPGRVLDHLGRGSLRLHAVSYLVLDEADEMLDSGFAPDVERILAYVPAERQTSLFSATTPEWVQNVATRHLRNPLLLQMNPDAGDGLSIEHEVCEVWHEEKSVLRKLLDPRQGAFRLGRRTYVQSGSSFGCCDVDVLGHLSQQQRSGGQAILEGSTAIWSPERGGEDWTYCTSGGSSYELPRLMSFTHRVGRTGRRRAGRAIAARAADCRSARSRGLGRSFSRYTGRHHRGR